MSFNVCAVSMVGRFRLSKKNFLMVAHIKNVSKQSCHIFKKNKNGRFIFDFFGSDPSKMDQTWSNLIKLDQIGFFTSQKMFLWQVFTFTKRIRMPVWFWIFLDQICPKRIKLDQTWSKLDFSPSWSRNCVFLSQGGPRRTEKNQEGPRRT